MNLEAEQNIIGSLLTHPECIAEIVNVIAPEMFVNEIYRRAYNEIRKGYENGITVDFPILCERIPDDNFTLEVVRGEIFTAIQNTYTSATVKSFAILLADEYRAKRLNEILKNIKVQPRTVNEDIDRMLVSLEALRYRSDSKLKTLAEITEENKDNYFKDDGNPKIMTGLRKLDEILGGFDGGDLVIIGARPAVGKSAFASRKSKSMRGS